MSTVSNQKNVAHGTRRLSSSGHFPTAPGFGIPHRVSKRKSAQKEHKRREAEGHRDSSARLVKVSRCRIEDWNFGKGLDTIWEYSDQEPDDFYNVVLSGSVMKLTLSVVHSTRHQDPNPELIKAFEIPDEDDIRLNDAGFSIAMRLEPNRQAEGSRNGDCWILRLWDRPDPVQSFSETKKMLRRLQYTSVKMAKEHFAYRHYLPAARQGQQWQLTGMLGSDAFKRELFGPQWQPPQQGTRGVLIPGERGAHVTLQRGQDVAPEDVIGVARGHRAASRRAKKINRVKRVLDRASETPTFEGDDIPQSSGTLKGDASSPPDLPTIQEEVNDDDRTINVEAEDEPDHESEEVESDTEWDVAELLDRQGRGRGIKDLVRWAPVNGKTYPDSWEPASNISKEAKDAYAKKQAASKSRH